MIGTGPPSGLFAPEPGSPAGNPASHPAASLPADWDVLVIGAGPGGALAALLLARQHRSVLLVDRRAFPRDKVCGGCLNNRALGILDQAHLLPAVAQAGGEWIDRFVVHARGRQLSVPLGGGWAISRWTLDPLLIEQARLAGAHVLTPTTASVLPDSPASDRRRVKLAGPDGSTRVVTTRVVVVADGLGHPSLSQLPEFTDKVSPASRVGLAPRGPFPLGDAGPPPGTIAMAVGRGGYVGLTRDETGAVHLAAAVDPATLRAGGDPAQCVTRILQEAGLPVPPHPGPHEGLASGWRGTGPLTHRLNRAASHRLFVIGDALRYVEPFTGEGMAWALTNAWHVAPLVSAGVDQWSGDLANRWDNAAFSPPALGCRWLASAARWPRSVSWAVAGLAHVPQLPRLAAHALDPTSSAVARWHEILTGGTGRANRPPGRMTPGLLQEEAA
ncbi:MAG: NAD(P)/FAD-dependent oxidoreductase [Planctomycetaceae bacterium]